MNIEKIMSKYPPVGPGETKEKPALMRWQDSPWVAALSEALRAYPEMGIELVMKDGRPTLHCTPGIDMSDPERWAFLEYVTDLAIRGRDDMYYLINNGLLQLRQVNGSFPGK